MRRLLLLLGLTTAIGLRAAEPVFDLAGPKVDVRVKRGEQTLPISQVPFLLAGDRLWVHPDLPESQSARFVLVVAFLRGATNPPPPEWFTRVETWTRQAQEEGAFVAVPAEAQQALVFLAPETGGDFSTLRNTVRGRPGTFVRAAQDLQIASLDRMRMERYLSEVKAASTADAKTLKERAELVARSLGIKLDAQCFDKPIDQQTACLMQMSEGMVMDDANAQSMVNQLASGSTLDLMNQISASSMGGGGAYSPYFGAIVDTAKILSSLHTAHFQYIPALALPTADTLNLRLNMAPSFRDPKSVVVVAMPPVGAVKAPLLHALSANQQFCVEEPGLVLPLETAPLYFATDLVHGLTLHIEAKGTAVDLPIKTDPSHGGLVLSGQLPKLPGTGPLTGVVRGKWGFDDAEGPHFRLRASEPGKWAVASGDETALVVGREDTLRLEDDSSQCVDQVEMTVGNGNPTRLTWKSPKPETLEIALPLQGVAPGKVTLAIFQHGLDTPDKIQLYAYESAASLERLTLSAGDTQAQLKGTRLDQVAKAEFADLSWAPATLSRVQDYDQLMLTASGPTDNLEPGKRYIAKVQLKDGRQLHTTVAVNPPRPQVILLSKGTQQEDPGAPISPVHLGSQDDIPLEGKLVFFLRSKVPAAFPRTEKVEVAGVDGSFSATLSLADGSLLLEDAKTAVGTLEPLKSFGPSAFGPMQIRAMLADGTNGEWIPLGVLVRVPTFKELHCTHQAAKTCTLAGTSLFLASSISSTAEFDNGVDIPADFTGSQLTVPRPLNGTFYVKLRDDPATVQTVNLATGLPQPPSTPPIATQPAQSATGSPSAPPATTTPVVVVPVAQDAHTAPAVKPQQ